MKVLQVINGLGPGGAERSLVELLPHYEDAGIEFSVACLKKKPVGFESEARDLVPIHNLSGESFWRRVFSFRKLVSRIQPDLIHTTLFEADLVGRFGAVGKKVPVLTSLVNTTYESVRKKDPSLNSFSFGVVQAVDALTSRFLTDHFHAISHAVKDSYVKTLGIAPERVTVVERGRDKLRIGSLTPERRLRTRAALGIDEDQVVLLTVGRQEYQKGQRYLIEAMPSLTEVNPNILLLVVGRPGAQTKKLERTVERAHLADHVSFLGHREDVTDIMAASDLFVFPSLFEGLGGSVLEAMALGIPIVASDLPVLREVIGDKAAVFACPGSPEELSRQIDRVIRKPELRKKLARAGRARFDERFQIEEKAGQMVDMYRSLVERCLAGS